MKRLILNILMLAGAMQLFAQHEYLTVRAKNGDETSVRVTTQTVINLKNGTLQATTNGETATFALNDLKAFFFAAQPTDIKSAAVERVFVKLTANGLMVNAPAAAKVSVLTMDGRSIMTGVKKVAGVETFPVALMKGVYVVRVGEKSQTIMVP
jgi:hypothetical protein